MKLEFIDTVSMPEYILTTIFNNDSSGIGVKDLENFKNWQKEYINQFGPIHYEIPNKERYFTCSPAFGLACMVYDVNIYQIIS